MQSSKQEAVPIASVHLVADKVCSRKYFGGLPDVVTVTMSVATGAKRVSTKQSPGNPR